MILGLKTQDFIYNYMQSGDNYASIGIIAFIFLLNINTFSPLSN